MWIEKKRVTIIVAFHFMKRRLKNKDPNHTDANYPQEFTVGKMKPPRFLVEVRSYCELSHSVLVYGELGTLFAKQKAFAFIYFHSLFSRSSDKLTGLF